MLKKHFRVIFFVQYWSKFHHKGSLSTPRANGEHSGTQARREHLVTQRVLEGCSGTQGTQGTWALEYLWAIEGIYSADSEE